MKSGFVILALTLLLGQGVAIASDAPPGAASCSGCHATNTAATTPVPKIHGRPAAETIDAMTEFRADKKPSTVMSRLAKGFTEDETRAIAEWLAAQK